MDYRELADELLRGMFSMMRVKPHRNITEAMRGEEMALNFAYARGDEPILPRELSKAMGCSTARVAAALNSLEKKGLVTREIDPDNRRQILVRLTDAGRELTEARRAEVNDHAAGLLALLGETDARELVRIIWRLAEATSSGVRPEQTEQEEYFDA